MSQEHSASFDAEFDAALDAGFDDAFASDGGDVEEVAADGDSPGPRTESKEEVNFCTIIC